MIPRTVVLLLIKPTIFCFLQLFVSAFALLLFSATAAVVFYVLVAVESLDPAARESENVAKKWIYVLPVFNLSRLLLYEK